MSDIADLPPGPKPRKPVRLVDPTTLPPYLFAPLSILVAISVVVGMVNRTLGDFIRYGGIIALIITPFVAFAFIAEWLKPGKRKILTLLAQLVGAAAGSAFIGAVYYSFAAGIKDIYLWTAAFGYTPWKLLSAILLVVASGCGLFFFRCRLRSIYGLTEALVGILVAVQRVWTAADEIGTDVLIILLTASVYLIVRGLDNVHQGLTKAPFDPVANRYKNTVLVMFFLRMTEPRHLKDATDPPPSAIAP